MGKGVLLKANATTWSNSQSRKFTGTTMTQNVIKHANASSWFDNYPMEQEYTQTFIATWSQGWLGDGTRLDDGVWKGNVLTASTTDYKGMFGFDKTAIETFIANGKVTDAKLQLNCYETTTNGSPDVHIGKHTYSAKPSGTWTGQNASWYDYVALHVANGATGGYTVTLKTSQIYFNGELCGGVALKGASATNEDHGKFSGVDFYQTKLILTVLK